MALYIRSKAWSLWVASTLITFAVAYRDRALAADDAYIHRRIAEQYAVTGHAWYNSTEKILGTSSPLWTILLALSYRLFGHFDLLVPILEAMAVGAATTIAALLALRLDEQKKMGNNPNFGVKVLGASFITWMCLLDSAVAQMESPLALALLLTGFLLLTKERRTDSLHLSAHAGLALIVLSILTRLEFMVFALLATIFLLWSRRWQKETFALAGAVALSGCLWLYHQFGTIVPNTISAKARAYCHIRLADVLNNFALTPIRLPLFFSLLLILGWMISKRYLSVSSSIGYIMALGGLILGSLYAINRTLVFPWYVPLVVLPFTLGMWLIYIDQSERIPQLISIILVLGGLRISVGQNRHLLQEALLGHRPVDGLWDAQAARVHEYLRVGSALNDICPGGKLLTSEIGGLGYSFHGYISDGLGLVTPEAVQYHPLHFPEDSPSHNDAAIPPRFAAALKPDLIVTYNIMGEAIINKAFSMGYTDLQLPPFPAEDYVPAGYYLGSMHVLVRKDGVCPVFGVEDALRRQAHLDLSWPSQPAIASTFP